MTIIDGGSAFPLFVQGDGSHPEIFGTGMTLRDYFAGQALVGLASACSDEGEWAYGDAPNVAGVAYEIADAMLKAQRQKP